MRRLAAVTACLVVTSVLFVTGSLAGGKTTGKKWGAPAGASYVLS